MKIIIAGSRTFDDYELLKSKCDKMLSRTKVDCIICGMAQGADLLGKRYAEENRYVVRRMEADWDKHGRSAGPIRNKRMAELGDALIAFWDGKSKGAENMINLAKDHGLKIRVVRF